VKPPWEWEEGDLLALIQGKIQESVRLDYKDSRSLQRTDARKKEISKDVSAFANSAGGVLVYGIREDEQGHFPEAIDDGVDPNEITKEWIDQVIASTIQRRIDDVRIKQIALTATRSGRVAYVVSVPQSPRAPHQANDHKFYKRFEFQSVPMEEYEIRDVARRLQVPISKLS
jgi:predicted HTH transcriptional regulator